MPRLRLFLADDHPLMRRGLRALVDSMPDMVVVGEAADGAAAVRDVVSLQPDVALIDVVMPVLGGAAAVAEIRRSCPAVRVLALSAHEDRGYVRAMMAAGAAGYVVKRAAADELLRAIRLVASGGTHFDASLTDAPPRPPSTLSPRETAVLRRLARGHAVKQVAATLDLSARTVETYKNRAMEKLGLASRADLVRHAMQQGWLDEE